MPALPFAMTDYLTTRELAELLRIKERKVYDLAASGAVPCSKATGKLLFPRRAIEAWLDRESSGPDGMQDEGRPNVFLGSHDPLLEWALRESRSEIATFFDGSADGLKRFKRKEGLAAGLHLYDPDHDDWNRPFIAQHFADQPVVLVQWATRERGLIIEPGIESKVRSIADLKGLRMAPRQAASGAQDLLLYLFRKADIALEDLDLLPAARSEADAALSVLEGKADVAFGLAALAAQYRLAFLPILKERFDLLIDRRAWFEPPLQAFFAYCRSDAMKVRAQELAGYDLSDFGKVHFNGR